MSHSLSPRLHNAAFAALGLDMVYVPLPVRSGDVEAAVRGLAALGFRGASVTIPHKAAVAACVDRLSGDARLIEAVNTVVVDAGRVTGHNTDVAGVREALSAAVGGGLRGEPALVLGAGGAARAAALALARLRMRLTVLNRTAAAAERLAELVIAAEPGASCAWGALSDLTPAVVRGQRVIVNATSLGMPGRGKVPACVADTVTTGQLVFDLVYASSGTDLTAAARDAGATVVGGLELLVRQAAAAFELWTGRPAPIDVMRAAVGA